MTQGYFSPASMDRVKMILSQAPQPIVEPIEAEGEEEEEDEDEDDDKTPMFLSSLKNIISNASETHANLSRMADLEPDSLPEWVVAKITMSADYLSVVRDYVVNGQKG